MAEPDDESFWITLRQDLLGWLCRMVPPDLAEDVAAETVLRQLRSRPGLAGTRHGRAYAFAAARNVLVDERRAIPRLLAEEPGALFAGANGSSLAGSIATVEELHEARRAARRAAVALLQAVRAMATSSERRVLRLLWRGVENGDIALSLQISIGQVRRLRRGLRAKADLVLGLEREERRTLPRGSGRESLPDPRTPGPPDPHDASTHPPRRRTSDVARLSANAMRMEPDGDVPVPCKDVVGPDVILATGGSAWALHCFVNGQCFSGSDCYKFTLQQHCRCT